MCQLDKEDQNLQEQDERDSNALACFKLENNFETLRENYKKASQDLIQCNILMQEIIELSGSYIDGHGEQYDFTNDLKKEFEEWENE